MSIPSTVDIGAGHRLSPSTVDSGRVALMADLFAVPQPLVDLHIRLGGDQGRAWAGRLPILADTLMQRWGLRRQDDRIYHGMVSLVLPVVRADGTPAALKLQPLDHETEGEPIALRVWNGDGTVQLLEFDPDSGAM